MHTNTHIVADKAVISLQGRFDFSAHREFGTLCGTVLGSKDVRELEIDLGKVEYLDSSALGMLLLLRERAENARKRVMLSNCRGAVKQVLDIANFGKLFRIV
jgi:HptB-dependent secretion and biofilm anti anti-sigma factor